MALTLAFEQDGARITDFLRGRSLGTRDHIVRWPKPKARPQWMTPEQYADAPEELKLRECRVAHQVLITTGARPPAHRQGRSV